MQSIFLLKLSPPRSLSFTHGTNSSMINQATQPQKFELKKMEEKISQLNDFNNNIFIVKTFR